MNIAITGGAGFIGSHIAEQLSKEHKVKIIDNFRTGKIENLKGLKLEVVRGDIKDLDFLTKEFKDIDYVFHLAAIVSVTESINDPSSTFETGTIGSYNVLEAAKRNNVKKVILSSSAAIYGNNSKIPNKETMFPDPLSPYALSKLDSEYLANMYSKLYNLPTVCLRYFNVFGPRQDPSSPYSGVISIFCNNAIKNKDITIFGDGKQTRDFIFVKDIVKANILGMEKGSGVYNVACGKGISINELAKEIIKQSNSKSKLIYKEWRKGDIKESIADISKIKKELNFKPDFNFEEGLKETLKYYS